MFDFEKLEVYKKAKDFNTTTFEFLKNNAAIDKTISNQYRRASFSIMLNIAEGSGRMTKPDKKNFYVIARGSVFECVAIIDYLKDAKHIEEDIYHERYQSAEVLSKMLFVLIKTLEK